MRGPSACMPRIHLTGTGYSSDWTVVWKMVQGIDDGEDGQVEPQKLKKMSKDRVSMFLMQQQRKTFIEVEGV